MKKQYFLVIIIPILFAFNGIHKYYVSLTDIEWNNEKNNIEIIMNVFIDDIELALNKDFKIDAKLNTKNQIKDVDKYYKSYLNKNFKLKINNKNLNYKYLGKEYEGNLVFFYLEINDIKSVNSISVENTMLIEYFNKQQNLIKVKVKEIRKSLFLNSEKYKGVLNFKKH